MALTSSAQMTLSEGLHRRNEYRGRGRLEANPTRPGDKLCCQPGRPFVTTAAATLALALTGEFHAVNLDTAIQNGNLGFSTTDTAAGNGEEVVNGQHVTLAWLHAALLLPNGQ